jgi:hypothetical protein
VWREVVVASVVLERVRGSVSFLGCNFWRQQNPLQKRRCNIEIAGGWFDTFPFREEINRRKSLFAQSTLQLLIPLILHSYTALTEVNPPTISSNSHFSPLAEYSVDEITKIVNQLPPGQVDVFPLDFFHPDEGEFNAVKQKPHPDKIQEIHQ